MKVIIYTCNINNYDTLKPVRDIDPNTQYLYYSNNNLKVAGWQSMKADMSVNEDPVKVARYYKINSHLLPPHEYSIWIDSSFELKSVNVLRYIKTYLGKNNIACYYHGKNDPTRNCTYMELAVAMYVNKVDRKTLISQISDYYNEGYPIGNDLLSTGIIIRKNNDKVRRFNEQWWSQIQKYSSRDQTSQLYAAWKEDITIKKIEEKEVYHNELVRYVHHIKKLEELKKKEEEDKIRSSIRPHKHKGRTIIKRIGKHNDEISTSISDNTETPE